MFLSPAPLVGRAATVLNLPPPPPPGVMGIPIIPPPPPGGFFASEREKRPISGRSRQNEIFNFLSQSETICRGHILVK